MEGQAVCWCGYHPSDKRIASCSAHNGRGTIHLAMPNRHPQQGYRHRAPVMSNEQNPTTSDPSDYYDDDPRDWDEEDGDYEDCGLMPDGQCLKAGSEECDWECPNRMSDLFA